MILDWVRLSRVTIVCPTSGEQKLSFWTGSTRASSSILNVSMFTGCYAFKLGLTSG